MKKLSIILLLIALNCGAVSYAYQYTEQEKNKIYNEFIKEYKLSINQQLSTMQLTESDKMLIKTFMDSNFNKKELINSSWSCIQTKNPKDQNGINECFVPWLNKQSHDLSEFVYNNAVGF